VEKGEGLPIEEQPMKHLFSPTSDRYGHLITGVGGPPQTMALFVLPSAEDIIGSPVKTLAAQEVTSERLPAGKLNRNRCGSGG
jgi:hypothetical protein